MALRAEGKGIALMLAGVAFLSANDALSKYLAELYPLGEVVFLRQVAGLAFIVPYALWAAGPAAFRVVDVAGQSWRAIAFLGTAFLMVASLAYLPLAIATAIAFSSPLWVAMLAGPALGETVTLRRWLAIAVGFTGVLIIMRPGGPDFSWALLLPLGTAIANAARDMMTRRLAATDTSLSILFWSAMLALVASAATLPFAWKTPTATDALWIVVAGLVNTMAHFAMISAYRYADASALSPYRYTSLIWAIILGWLVWSHLPDAWSLVGSAIIVVAALVAMGRAAPKPAKPQTA